MSKVLEAVARKYSILLGRNLWADSGLYVPQEAFILGVLKSH